MSKQQRAKKRRRIARRFLRAFMEELRVIFKRRVGAEYERFPEQGRPCSTCAFNPSTDSWRGAENTAWRLMQALMGEQPFYCHDGFPIGPDGEYQVTHPEARLCSGWLVVQNDPDSRAAVARAARTAFVFEGALP